MVIYQENTGDCPLTFEYQLFQTNEHCYFIFKQEIVNLERRKKTFKTRRSIKYFFLHEVSKVQPFTVFDLLRTSNKNNLKELAARNVITNP